MSPYLNRKSRTLAEFLTTKPFQTTVTANNRTTHYFRHQAPAHHYAAQHGGTVSRVRTVGAGDFWRVVQ